MFIRLYVWRALCVLFVVLEHSREEGVITRIEVPHTLLSYYLRTTSILPCMNALLYTKYFSTFFYQLLSFIRLC